MKWIKESGLATGYFIFMSFVLSTFAIGWMINYSNTHTNVNPEMRELAKEFATKNKISVIGRDLTENNVYYRGELCYHGVVSNIEFRVDTHGNFEIESIEPKIIKIDEAESDGGSVVLLAGYSYNEYKGKTIKCNDGVDKLWTPVGF